MFDHSIEPDLETDSRNKGIPLVCGSLYQSKSIIFIRMVSFFNFFIGVDLTGFGSDLTWSIRSLKPRLDQLSFTRSISCMIQLKSRLKSNSRSRVFKITCRVKLGLASIRFTCNIKFYLCKITTTTTIHFYFYDI